jgi:hypothetical protein
MRSSRHIIPAQVYEGVDINQLLSIMRGSTLAQEARYMHVDRPPVY